MSFLDDIAKYAPTIGGVLGGIGGEVIDPFGGGVVGAGLGSALGKGIENESQGKGMGGVSDLETGVEGAAGQGAGDLLGGAVGAIGSAVGKSGEGATEAATQTATDTADAEKAATESQQGIDKATATKANYGSLSPLKQKINNLGGNQDFVDSMGLEGTNPYDMRTVAQGGYEMNDVVGKALNGVQIDTSGAANPILKLVQKGETQTPEANAIMRAFRTANVPLGPNGEIPPTLDASTVRSLTQSLGKEIGDQQVRISQVEKNGFNATPMKEELNSLQNARDDFVSRLSNNDQVNANIKASTITPEHQAVLAEKYGEPLANHIATKVNGAQNYSDIIPEMQRFAQMGNASDTAIDDIERVSGTDRAIQRAKLAGDATKPVTAKNVADKTAADHLLDAAQSGAAGRKASAISSAFKAGKKLEGGPPGSIRTKVGSLLERISPFTSTKGLDDVEPMLHTGILNKVPGAMGATISTSPNVAQGAAAQQNQGGAIMPPTTGNPPVNPLLQTYGNNQQSIQTLMGMLGTDPFLSSSLAPALASEQSTQAQLAPKAQQMQGAVSDLAQLEQAFKQAGGGQGMVGGTLAQLGGGLTGQEVAAYKQQAQRLVQILGQLGLGNVPLPQVTQTPGAAQAGFGQVQSLLGSVPAQ